MGTWTRVAPGPGGGDLVWAGEWAMGLGRAPITLPEPGADTGDVDLGEVFAQEQPITYDPEPIP